MDNKRLDILIARIKESGDETAFAEFYELTSKGLFSYLLSIVRRREVAEDLMQDTYVRFRQSVQSYKSGNPAAFLIEIGKHIAFNHIKRAKYETATDFSEWEPVSGEKSVESFAKRLRAAFDFSLSIKTISKEDLADRAKKYLQNATSSMSFEQLTAAFAKRKSLLEESWLGDKSIFSDVYYKYAEEEIKRQNISSDYVKSFTKGSYAEMIESLKSIESMCEILGLTDLQAKVAEIRISLENIDFAKIKTMYDNYITGLINDILNPSEQTSNSIFNI